RPAVALTVVVRRRQHGRGLEDHRSEVDAEARHGRGQVRLGGGAGLHADRAALEVGEGVDARVLADHEALAVGVGGRGEVGAPGGVAAAGPGRVADVHVDLAGLQGGRAVAGGEGTVDVGVGVTGQGCCEGLAEVVVEADVIAALVDVAVAGQVGVDTATQLTALLDLVHQALREDAAGQRHDRQDEYRSDGSLHGYTFPYLSGFRRI